MSRWFSWLFLGSSLLVMLASPMAAQTFLPRASSDLILEQLSKPAEKIFAGTVLRIEQATTNDSEPAAVLVSFRVDEAVRGSNAGETIVLREWAELWVRNDRYRVGQRVLIFLYPPSEAGLSSPVAGDLGKINIGPSGLLRVTTPQAYFSSSQTDVPSSQSDARPTHGESNDSTRVRLRSDRTIAVQDEASK